MYGEHMLNRSMIQQWSPRGIVGSSSSVPMKTSSSKKGSMRASKNSVGFMGVGTGGGAVGSASMVPPYRVALLSSTEHTSTFRIAASSAEAFVTTSRTHEHTGEPACLPRQTHVLYI